jgi:hypothetical protein
LLLSATCGRLKIALNKQTSNGLAAFEFTVAKPESVGFHRERLVRLHALMQRNVEETAPRYYQALLNPKK